MVVVDRALSDEGRMLLRVGFLALVVRLVFLTQHAGSAFFGVPILDEAFYDALARALLAGEDLSPLNPAFRPMLYPALLAKFYAFAGEAGYVAVLLFQHLLGVATAVLAASCSTRLFRSTAAGACAGVLYALAGPPIYFESRLLNTALFTFGVTLFLFLASRLDGRSPVRWAWAGGVLGLAAQARPNVLPVVGALVLMALWNPWKAERRRVWAGLAAAMGGLLLVLGLAGWWQMRTFQGFYWLPTSGGVNFYLGNRVGADGMIPRQERHVSYGDRYQDSVQVFSRQIYGEETGAEVPYDPRAVSDFWYAKAVDEMRSDPLRVTGLLAKKTLFLLWNHEIPNNNSYVFFASREAPLLGYLPVRWAVLLMLAVLGATASLIDRTYRGWILLFLGTYGFGVVLFFVNARYRAPLWPVLSILAGGGLWILLQWIAARLRSAEAPKVSRRALVGALSVGLMSAINWLGVEPESPYRDYFFRSLAHQQKGDLEAAVLDAEKAVELGPEEASAHFQLGTLALAGEETETAVRHLGIAAGLLPTEPRVLNNLGIALERDGDYPAAFLAYLKAAEIGPAYSPPWVNLALLELRAGELKRAGKKIEHAENLGDRSVNLQCARGFWELMRGNEKLGRALIDGAMKRDEELTRRLVEEHRRPLVLERRPAETTNPNSP